MDERGQFVVSECQKWPHPGRVRPLSQAGSHRLAGGLCALLFGGEALGLVDNAGRDTLECLRVGARVMSAEKELAAHFKFELHVGLSAAAIAAIVRGQSAFFKHRFHAPIVVPTRARSEQRPPRFARSAITCGTPNAGEPSESQIHAKSSAPT